MEKIIKYEVQDVYCTIDEKRDLKWDEHYLYKKVYKVKDSGWLIPTNTKFVKVVNENWLKHHKTYYNHDVIDNTETTTNLFGYYCVRDNYHFENKFRTNLLGKKKITVAGTTMTNEQVKNPSYDEWRGSF